MGTAPVRISRAPMRGRAWLPFLAGFLVVWGALAGTASLDATGRLGLVILAVTLGAAALVEVVFHRTPAHEVVKLLGFGRPRVRALLAAAAVSAAILGVFPLFTLVTGLSLGLRSNWPWLLIGIFAFHGLAEELTWRGYAFRRLRAGRSFWRAVLWTMPLVAAAHVPVIAGNGLAIGAGAMVVATVTSLPLAYLYETGGRTIWAPALVHTAIDSFKLVVVTGAAAPMFSLLIIAVSLLAPLLVFTIPRRAFDPDAATCYRAT